MTKKSSLFILLTSVLLLSACASTKPLTAEQIKKINSYPVQINKLPENFDEKLYVYSKNNRVGGEATGIAIGLLTGAFTLTSDGNTPRTRINDSSNFARLKNMARRASADKIESVKPTQDIHELLTKSLNAESASDTAKNKMNIRINPIAWHLYYDKFWDKNKTYYLEYAADIKINLRAERFYRDIECDKQSNKNYTKEEWIANDFQLIKKYSQELADECLAKVLKATGKSKAS